MNHHQVKHKITAVTSASCLIETDTAPNFYHTEEWDCQEFLWCFFIELKSQSGTDSDEIMCLADSSPLCFQIITSKWHFATHLYVWVVLSHSYFCTTQSYKKNVISLEAHGKNQPNMSDELKYKIFSKFVLDWGKCILSSAASFCTSSPLACTKITGCVWFSAWSFLEQSF